MRGEQGKQKEIIIILVSVFDRTNPLTMLLIANQLEESAYREEERIRRGGRIYQLW